MILTETSTMSSEEIKAEYTSSLADLTFNSKPLINVLTMLAEENVANAADIVAAIEEHLAKVRTDIKLPVLYLIDCIAKNIGETYTSRFSQNIVQTFCSVFKVVDEKTRAEMFKLRQTWNDIFPQKKLYAIDVQINLLDPAWPVTAQPPSATIHFNPKFLKSPEVTAKPETNNAETITMQQQLIQKQKELIELQQKKLELELLQTQVKLQKQMKNKPTQSSIPVRAPGVKMQQAPKIAPVNSALVAAGSKPIRDPRLLRQQVEKSNNGTSSNISVALASKTLDSNNKNVAHSKNVRDSRNDPRLVNNKDSSLSPQKSKTLPKSRLSDKASKQRSKLSNDSDSKLLKSADSPTKSKSELRSPIARHKKLEKKSFKRDRDGKSHKNVDVSPTAFKGIKGSTKGRNYMRRNRSPSSPEQDVDLRLTAPEAEENSKSPSKRWDNPPDQNLTGTEDVAAWMDVDLRETPAGVSKKRLSTEIAEGSSSKKPKTGMFDVLFGDEDTDLRTVLPVAQPERPRTPPPPIISNSDEKKTNLAEIRAKLANATGRDKIMAQSFRKKRLQEDEDLRVSDSMKKIIISPVDEQCIKDGTMTKEQGKQLMNKIIAQMEHQKLKEAQLKDKEESVEEIHAVSDDEVTVINEGPSAFGDQDDRVAPNYKWEGRDSRRGGGQFWRGPKRRHWDNNTHNMAPRPRPWVQHPANAWRPIGPPREFEPAENDGKKSPEELVVDSVNQDDIKTINIDGMPRDIRYYDETAIVFMNWDDPKEISFQNGTRRVVFDDSDIYLLSFNEAYQDVTIGGKAHRVRLGAPSREIFINGKPYECYFGGPGITIDLYGQMVVVKLDGPAPQVKIGTVKRNDLVAGKVNLIIDARTIVPVFLDAKVQKFVIDGETHTLKFVDALKTVLINDVPFKVEFGGLPKPITVHDKKHFIRFSVLPRGVIPGLVSIKDMEGCAPVAYDEANMEGSAFAHIEPALPVFGGRKKRLEEPEQDRNSPLFFQQNNLDMLSSVMTSSMEPSTSSSGYLVESQIDAALAFQPPVALPSSININDLFQKLVATGIVATKQPIRKPDPKPVVRKSPLQVLKVVTFAKPETLKLRQSVLYEALYSGMQCSSCGMRFPPEQSIHYSQHLDWHFRQNRKGKKNMRVAASRRWYYPLADWKNYEEIEDLEQREKNFFDQQSQEGAEAEEEVEIPSVLASSDGHDSKCELCQDKFDQFFNEDKEEWHLRNAVRADDKTYHPLCYKDYQQSLLDASANESKEEQNIEEDLVERENQNIPGLEIILDDDEVEEVVPEEVVVSESEDPKLTQDNKSEEAPEEEEDDDDVIIHEVVPEHIEVDDDKEYTENIPSAVLAVKVEEIDDGFMDVEEGLINIKNGGQVKIKSEPIDHDESLEEVLPEPAPFLAVSQPMQLSSMDGNSEVAQSAPSSTPAIGGRIKINISKQLPVMAAKEPKEVPCDSVSASVIDPSQPLPPGEEPIQLNIKPALRALQLRKMPRVKRGRELTGMCSIM